MQELCSTAKIEWLNYVTMLHSCFLKFDTKASRKLCEKEYNFISIQGGPLQSVAFFKFFICDVIGFL